MGLISGIIDAFDYMKQKKCSNLIAPFGRFLKGPNYNDNFMNVDIYLHSTGPSLRDFFSVIPKKDINFTKRPDKYIYTSATVGGITTGGVSKVEGGYDINVTTRSYFTLGYGSFAGGFSKAKPIYKIYLSEELFKKAKDSKISSWTTIDKKADPDRRYSIHWWDLTEENGRTIIDWLAESH